MMAGEKEKLLYTLWGAAFTGITARAFIVNKRRRSFKSNAEYSTKRPDPLVKVKKPAESQYSEVIKILRSLKGKRTVAHAGCFALAILARLLVQIKVSRLIGKLGSLLSQRKWKKLKKAQILFAFWTIPAALMNALVSLSQTQLSAAISQQLLNQIHQNYRGARFSQISLQLSDADQRTTSDLERLSDELSVLYQSLFKPLTETTVLTLTLTRLMGARQILLCYLYFFMAAMWSRKVTPSFTTSAEIVQEKESSFKSSHSRVYEYAEEVDFLDGSELESALMERKLDEMQHQKTILSFQKFVSSAIDGYAVRYMGILASIVLMMPALKLKGEARVEDPTEYFLTVLHLLVNLMTAFKDVATGFRTLGSVRGISKRVVELLDASSTKNRSESTVAEIVRYESQNVIEVKGVTIQVPGIKQPLFKDLNLTVKAGESVFIKGPNGSGKTSLFRILRGIWIPTSGQIGMPSKNACFFLTHKPYFVPGLPLRDQITYPSVGVPDTNLDIRIAESLVAVGLFSSTKEVLKYGILNSDWLAGKDLSAGEAQRLACARLLVRKPIFAFIDEGLSCCTEDFEKEFLKHCIESLNITCLSISHREVTRSLHHSTLHINANGRCNLVKN